MSPETKLAPSAVAAAETGGKTSLRARLALLTITILLTLVFLEGAVRIRQYFRYGAGGSSLYSTTVDAASGLVIPTPGQKSGHIVIDSRGFRNPELAVPKPQGTIRLAFIGASTTFCAEASSNEKTWPHLVWQQLQSKWPDVRFDYVNGGVPGYTTATSLRNLESRIAPLSPDVIVIYHAVNDLSRDSRTMAEAQGIIRGPVDEPGLLGRWSLTWSLVEKNLRLLARQRSAAAEASRHLVFQPEELSKGFRERLQQLVEAAQHRAPVVALATFSQRVRQGQSREQQLEGANTHLYYMPHMRVEDLVGAFHEYNRVIREVAAARGALLIDGEDSIPADKVHFNDSVHFTDAGSARMARRVTDSLVQANILRGLGDKSGHAIAVPAAR